MTLGEAIKKHRISASYTQAELGKCLGVGRSTIARYESGDITPPSDTVFKLQDIFKDDFLNDALGFSDDDFSAYKRTIKYLIISPLCDNYIPDYRDHWDEEQEKYYSFDLIITADQESYIIDSNDAEEFAKRCYEHLLIEFKRLLIEKCSYNGVFDGEL